jgi:hypothetical protein
MKRYWETGAFWKDAGERIVTSLIFGVVVSLSVTGGEVGWKTVLGGGIASALSTVKAIIGATRSNTTTPVSIT